MPPSILILMYNFRVFEQDHVIYCLSLALRLFIEDLKRYTKPTKRVALIRIIKLEAKKVMINEKGSSS